MPVILKISGMFQEFRRSHVHWHQNKLQLDKDMIRNLHSDWVLSHFLWVFHRHLIKLTFTPIVKGNWCKNSTFYYEVISVLSLCSSENAKIRLSITMGRCKERSDTQQTVRAGTCYNIHGGFLFVFNIWGGFSQFSATISIFGPGFLT